MKKKILIIGKQGAGKTALAENLARSYKRALLIDELPNMTELLKAEMFVAEQEEENVIYVSNAITPEEATALKGFTVIHLSKNV